MPRHVTAIVVGSAAFTTVALLTACDPGTLSTVTTGSSGVGIARRTVAVHAVVDPADAALRDSLGWTGGVPAAVIRVLRNGTTTWEESTTDANGRLELENLVPGTYRIYASRVLTEEEACSVGCVRRAFGDGQTVDISGSDSITLHLLADRPSGLLISEIGNGTPYRVSYQAGMYFEIYNNSDQVLYLDGRILGANEWGLFPTQSVPCSAMEPLHTDSLGVPVRVMLRFPGGGTQYPVAPGQVITVAGGAIDHRPVDGTLLDLSFADFEIGDPKAADNPAVPNLETVSPDVWRPQILFQGVFVLAEPLDPETLPVVFRDPFGRPYLRVPKEKLIDVAVLRSLWADFDLRAPPCTPVVHRDFDRYEGGFNDIGFGADPDPEFSSVRGFQRLALRRAPDGRVILFNTNTSAVDFEYALKTPGWVPESKP